MIGRFEIAWSKITSKVEISVRLAMHIKYKKTVSLDRFVNTV